MEALPGRQVGPQGTCTAAAWSPDGQWMYFGAVVDGSSHLWRQRFPDGAPEQITFGPTEEEGIALAPDGRSLVTSVGHASERDLDSRRGRRAGDRRRKATPRPPAFPGMAHACSISLCGTGGCRHGGWVASVSRIALGGPRLGEDRQCAAGRVGHRLRRSRDEKEVAFTTTEQRRTSQIWLAPLDRRTPPRQIARGGDQVSFGADGDLIFRSLGENNASGPDQEGRNGTRTITTPPVLDKFDVSPDGEWVIASSQSELPGSGTFAIPSTAALPGESAPPARSRGLSDGSFYVGATWALSRPPRDRRSRFPCRPANRCRICPALESTLLLASPGCQAPG